MHPMLQYYVHVRLACLSDGVPRHRAKNDSNSARAFVVGVLRLLVGPVPRDAGLVVGDRACL